MRKPNGDERREQGRRGRYRAILWSPAVCLLALGLTGCSGLKGGSKPPSDLGGDPLVGGGPPLPSRPPTTGRSQAPPPPPPTSLPPPPPISATSTAALASATARPPGATSDLRIGDPPRSPAPGTLTGQPASPPPPPDGTILHRPQPLTDPARQAPPAAVSPPPPPGPAPAPAYASVAPTRSSPTYEQLQAQLATRGVSWQRLEMAGPSGDWEFTCSVPNRQNPNVNRTYKGRARGPVEAIQAVLDQMDKDRS